MKTKKNKNKGKQRCKWKEITYITPNTKKKG